MDTLNKDIYTVYADINYLDRGLCCPTYNKYITIIKLIIINIVIMNI